MPLSTDAQPATPVATQPAAIGIAARDGDLVARLERLAELHRRGQLSEAEFAAAKARLLDEPAP